ncbi:SDR family oxidoreductase [Lacisediminihabitans profunda]|uniref:SDR family oxidoreductase n=1 Tax=Lacisediminihabitans profunda TaxID=2594790 RepID=A0A5C8URK7_9MICO|nr:SDR family NAD(P)-dependent oxidoreductase [Lacisediminihabitans profunda]TXN30595.1 SDR family oxidoreductase [Lacisediminihabitans profunda]
MITITGPQWAQTNTDISGKTVLVIGGGGGVGEGVVRTLLDSGATVVATGRNEDRLNTFAERISNRALHVATLDGLGADLDEKAAALASRFGPFDGVVVSIASWGEQGTKPLLTITDDEWKALVEDNLTAVFRVYRALTPTLAPGGVLLQLNGLSADIPFPGNGVVALGAAAGKSLTRTLAAELDGTGLRVYEVVLGVDRTRARQLAGVDNRRWIDGTEIGSHIAELVAGTSPLTGEVLHYFVDKAVGPVTTPPQF